jgi:flagellar biosynthesis/type III secretory pathway protein FliH
MELSPLYLQRLEEATQRGIEQGIQQSIEQGIEQGIQQSIERQRLMVESMLQVYFGEIDEELSQLIEPLIQLEPIEIARMIMQLDRTEITS